MLTQVSIRSSNTKTGPLATTSRDQTTCPTTCALYRNGCYATGRIFAIARKFGSEGYENVIKLITDLKPGQGVRLNVAGDFLLEAGSPDLDYIAACNRVAVERPDCKIIAYTHAWRTLDPSMFAFGVNASCDTDADIAEARAAGWGTVTVGAEDGTMIAGTRVVRCPAEYRDDTSCATCMLCAATPKINTTVTFSPHGGSKAKAQAVADRRKG